MKHIEKKHEASGEIALDALAANAALAGRTPPEIVQWAADTFGRKLIMTSSFGAESMCLIHMANTALPGIPIVFINTGYLFPQTLAFMEALRNQYRLNVMEFHSEHDPVVWLSINGESDPRVRQDVDACCKANKNSVFDRAMTALAPAAWLRGIRADQSELRAKMDVVEVNRRTQSLAISPLLKWTARDIHQYMRVNELPYHPLWNQGYASIGCNPETCTRPLGDGQSQRDGRWSGTDKKECGIHLDQGAGI